VIDHAPYLYKAQALVQAQIDDFVKYPPRQKSASFNLDSVLEELSRAAQVTASRPKSRSGKKAA
jgi:hypothetical protein